MGLQYVRYSVILFTTLTRCQADNNVVLLTTMDKLDTLAAIARNLTATLSAEDRYQRLLEALHIAIPYDAAALFRVQGESLIPLASRGLTPDAMGREYSRLNHPRLDMICNSREPILFSKDSSLPDPFDGLLSVAPRTTHHIHACLGCPLYVDGLLVGVLTADALTPNTFDHLPQEYLNVIGLMAGAQMQTVDLLTALEKKAKRQGQLASDLMADIHSHRGQKILGKSSVIEELRQEIELLAKSEYTSLVLGETGVGKELVTRAIHNGSKRRDKPLLYLNCAALPDSLAESELFGHTKGAFTGAVSDRTGKFELADEGTLFLDEIGELSLEIQAKILRVIQEGEVQRVGSERMIIVDVRLLAATNRDLELEVGAGRFRADLYHRLNVYPLRVPPLRERKEDIPILAGFFAERSMTKLGLSNIRISEGALKLLSRYSWPGNVRELENIISRSVLKASKNVGDADFITITPNHLAGDLGSTIYTNPVISSYQAPLPEKISLREEVKSFQTKLVQEALQKNSGSWAGAARDLDMNRSNLHNLATRLGLRQKNQP
ncbi:MAG: anaerobic nitric oxide reductase transcription regulator [Desulforhopalus sp.]|jgi:anaerobic nitric oxide reductase transcription regulator